MTSKREFTVDGIIEDAIQGVKEYIEVCEQYEKPTTADDKEKLFTYLVESPADWTGYYEPEITFEGIDWESIDNFTSEEIITAIRFAQRYGYYREDEPWVREVMSALRLYVSYFRFDEIIDRAWEAMSPKHRMLEMLKKWEASHLELAEGEITFERNAQAEAEKYVARTIRQIADILEDESYMEDMFREWEV